MAINDLVDSVSKLLSTVVPDQSSDNAVDWGSSNKVERHMVVHHSSLLLARWPELCIRVTDELMKVLGA